MRIRVSRVEQPGERAPSDGLRILLGALDRGLDVRDLAAQLVLGEGRPQQRLGEEIEAQIEILPQHGEGQGAPVAPGF